MEKSSPPALNPVHLPPGTGVGPWRIEAWAGRGVYGAVYRAVSVVDVHAPPAAVKVALLPDDPRFAREVELLSSTRHPSIPALYGHGVWQSPGGALYPFIAMQWIDGVPLYDWARLHPPSQLQVFRLLAQLARALQALHARASVHRDVKGANVLMRHSDNRAFLTDFGSGIHPGAVTLTPPSVYPGTPAYRAPESWLFELQYMREPSARYHAGPGDDLYALGVTACRLLTGEYPQLAAPTQDEHGTWHLEAVRPPAALLNGPGVEPRLRAFVLRMLSVCPEERGTAAQLAKALERASSVLPEARESSKPRRPRAFRHSVQPWLLPAAAGLALAAKVWWSAPAQGVYSTAPQWSEAARTNPPDADSTGLGEAAALTSTGPASGLQVPEGLAEDTLPDPLPGQTRPDSKGRCPHKGQVALNRGCWVEIPVDREACETLAISGHQGRMFQNKCYVPVLPSGRRPTSGPTEPR